MTINVRTATTSDIPEIIYIIKKSHRISFASLYPQKLIEDFCKKYTTKQLTERFKNTIFFVAEDTQEKHIRGVIALTENRLRTFFVDPLFQNKGIGKRLYETLESKARENHIHTLILEGSPLGEPIYEHFGFRKVRILKKERIGIPYTDALMEKNIT